MIPAQYSTKDIEIDEASSSYIKEMKKYSDTQEEYESMAKSLNDWIDGEGKSRYPDLTFRRWKSDVTEKVIFE